MRLHLGCGEVHLDGYLNIDYPPASHTVQTKSAADEYHNILELSYPANSIDEIRLHHVFEHFQRATALGLLAGWWSWLKVGGLLRIEVPDFDRTARAVLNPFSSDKARFVGLRHIFGSQEASWAFHMEGWSAKRLSRVLTHFGYDIQKVDRNAYQGTYNIDVYALKTSQPRTRETFEQAAQEWLAHSTVDNSETEKRMLNVWMQQLTDQLQRSWSSS